MWRKANRVHMSNYICKHLLVWVLFINQIPVLVHDLYTDLRHVGLWYSHGKDTLKTAEASRLTYKMEHLGHWIRALPEKFELLRLVIPYTYDCPTESHRLRSFDKGKDSYMFVLSKRRPSYFPWSLWFKRLIIILYLCRHPYSYKFVY